MYSIHVHFIARPGTTWATTSSVTRSQHCVPDLPQIRNSLFLAPSRASRFDSNPNPSAAILVGIECPPTLRFSRVNRARNSFANLVPLCARLDRFCLVLMVGELREPCSFAHCAVSRILSSEIMGLDFSRSRSFSRLCPFFATRDCSLICANSARAPTLTRAACRKKVEKECNHFRGDIF